MSMPHEIDQVIGGAGVLQDAEIAIEGEHSAAQGHRILDLLRPISGVQDANVYGGLVAVRFDPHTISRDSLRAALVDAGFRVAWITVQPVASEIDPLRPTGPISRVPAGKR